MALIFPPSPNVGDRFPLDPGLAGTSQWEYDGSTWNIVPTAVQLGGTPNQDGYNTYMWPDSIPPNASYLENDGTGVLSWFDYTPSTGGRFVKLNNPFGYNGYVWPNADGTAGEQLTTDGAGNLSWEVPAAPSLQILSLLEYPFNGNDQVFTLVKAGTAIPFEPIPDTNIVVFLGGVPQIPGAAYTVNLSTITFSEKPLPGATFYAISSVVG